MTITTWEKQQIIDVVSNVVSAPWKQPPPKPINVNDAEMRERLLAEIALPGEIATALTAAKTLRITVWREMTFETECGVDILFNTGGSTLGFPWRDRPKLSYKLGPLSGAINDWAAIQKETRDGTIPTLAAFKKQFGRLNTPGQLVRVFPYLSKYLPPNLKEIINNAERTSRLPNGFDPDHPEVEWVVEELHTRLAVGHLLPAMSDWDYGRLPMRLVL